MSLNDGLSFDNERRDCGCAPFPVICRLNAGLTVAGGGQAQLSASPRPGLPGSLVILGGLEEVCSIPASLSVRRGGRTVPPLPLSPYTGYLEPKPPVDSPVNFGRCTNIYWGLSRDNRSTFPLCSTG